MGGHQERNIKMRLATVYAKQVSSLVDLITLLRDLNQTVTYEYAARYIGLLPDGEHWNLPLLGAMSKLLNAAATLVAGGDTDLKSEDFARIVNKRTGKPGASLDDYCNS
jgi:hypothetical protein